MQTSNNICELTSNLPKTKNNFHKVDGKQSCLAHASFSDVKKINELLCLMIII